MTDQLSTAPAFPQRLNPDLAPLTMQQQRAWFMENLQPGTPAFNLTSAHRLTGRLDEAALERAFALLLQRHPALRTVVAVEDGEPVQRVQPEMPASLFPAQDLSAMPARECEDWLERRLAALAAQPFDLMAGPLWRAQVFRLAPGEHVIFFMVHQIVWDSASFDLFCRDMAALYAALAQGQPVQAQALVTGLGDFAAWQREWLQGGEAAAQLAHWKALLQGGLEPLDLPADKARPAQPSGHAGSLWIEFTRAEADAVQALAHRAGTTPLTVLLALFAALLQRMTQRQDFIVGTPALARRPGLEAVLGSFANTLPLRLRVDPKAPLLALIEATRDVVKTAARHAELPFEHLVRELDLPRDASRSPVHQVAFSYHDLRVRPAQWGALQYRAQATPPAALAEDLALDMAEHDEGLRGLLAYNADVFASGSMALLGERFAHLVRLALDMPELAVESATAPSLGEQMRMKAWNATDAAYDRSATVGRLLEAQLHVPGVAARTAVSSGSAVLTYAQLHGRAEQMARVLRERGIGRGRLVGLCVDRGVDMLVAQLAVLKSGAGYVPLDPAYPADRLAYMAEHSRLAALVTHSTLADTVPWPREQSLWLDQDRPAIDAQPTGPLPDDDRLDAQPQDPAYVIYTSGSTGKPKGVAVPHGAVVNFLLSMQREPGLGRDDVLVAVTTLSFDIAVLELLLPLVCGAQVVLASREQVIDGVQLKNLLQAHQASVMQATPATWRMLIEAGWQGTPTFKALIGGEALALDLAQQLLQRCGQLWNMYGPTETTVWSTCIRVQQPEAGISIGHPIANTQVHILDEQLQLTPIGVSGEIWIGGEGVTLGYLHRPELTAERFVDDPFSPGNKLYRTGDKGRWRHDGQLEHLGRLDFQVKVRGYRIELGEIEAALATHPEVARCVVITREDQPGDVRLVAYVVPRGEMPAAGAIKEHLSQSLPQYMLPQHVVALQAVPLLPNGKVDRKGLPAPRDEARAGAGFAAPRTDAERAIAEIWAELLGIARVSTSDNFFDLGGHSLLAMRAVTMIEARLGRSLQVRRFIFETLGQLAATPAGGVVHALPARAPAPPPAPRRTGVMGRLFGAFRSGGG
ncbi:MAG TPA: amino acid adenylation domain-containing protein [Burkholderiaceae bacterium]|nr:amino acid adenylation domain-containing protein [Burkholderiaceae bacterium]